MTFLLRKFIGRFCKACDVFSGIVLLLVQCSVVKVIVGIQLQILEKKYPKMTEYSMQLVRQMNCRRILGEYIMI
jgi:hypothetical protein